MGLALALAFAGCAGPPADAPPSVEPVVDPNNWDYDVTFDDFAAAFDELDSSALEEIDGLTAMHNDRAWSLGSSSTGGAGIAHAWVESIVGTFPESNSGTASKRTTYYAVWDGESRDISFTLNDLGEGAFILVVTSSD